MIKRNDSKDREKNFGATNDFQFKLGKVLKLFARFWQEKLFIFPKALSLKQMMINKIKFGLNKMVADDKPSLKIRNSVLAAAHTRAKNRSDMKPNHSAAARALKIGAPNWFDSGWFLSPTT